jgi:hypothetical protein
MRFYLFPKLILINRPYHSPFSAARSNLTEGVIPRDHQLTVLSEPH